MFKRLLDLIRMFFTDRILFKYYFKHYLNSTVSVKKAKKISKKNDLEYENIKFSRYVIETYDGSNQYTHPDCIKFNNKYWLIITPYPYGMEAYENPCIYNSDSLTDMKQIFEAPISDQKVIRRRQHLSDPFFCINDDTLIALYRRNEFENGKPIVRVDYRIIDSNLKLNEEKNLISTTDDLLSPFMIKNENKFIFQYMNKTSDGSDIIEIIYDDKFNVIEKNTVKAVGFPENYYFWHFGINHECKDDNIGGLILIRNKQNEKDFVLCNAKYDVKNKEWTYVNTVNIPDEIKNELSHIYKSCYIPDTNKILLSIHDKKRRYYCSLIENN